MKSVLISLLICSILMISCHEKPIIKNRNKERTVYYDNRDSIYDWSYTEYNGKLTFISQTPKHREWNTTYFLKNISIDDAAENNIRQGFHEDVQKKDESDIVDHWEDVAINSLEGEQFLKKYEAVKEAYKKQ